MSKPRCRHSTTAFSLCTGQTKVTMFGGSTDGLGKNKLADTTLLQFSEFISIVLYIYMYMYINE